VFDHFLGAFGKLHKAVISFIMSFCPSICMEKLGYHCMDFYEILYTSIYQNCQEIQGQLKSNKDNAHFT
jgi:hypothetical protein